MVAFTATIKKFGQQGEKTGWTYIELPAEMAEQLQPGMKKSFRVKGKLDKHSIEGVAMLPMGGGDFIIPLNGEMRKAIGKTKGATLEVKLQVDKKEFVLCPELIECLNDEPKALEYFSKLPPSHQKYYSKWIESAKTEPTKAKRIATAVTGMARGMDYGQMLRAMKEENKLLGKA
jgi:hypothetical protein